MFENLEKELFQHLTIHNELPVQAYSDVLEVGQLPDVSTPVVYATYAIASNSVKMLHHGLEQNYTTFKQNRVVPDILSFLKAQKNEFSSVEALECLAYCKFEYNEESLSSDDLEIPSKFDFHPWKLNVERNESSSSSGRASTEHEVRFPKVDTGLSKEHNNVPGYFTSKPWILNLLVTNTNRTKSVVDEWWPIVIPALLNLLDTTDITLKARAIDITFSLVKIHEERILVSGLIPIFESSIEPCLSYLSPLIEPTKTELIHRKAVLCLSQLARSSNTRLNFIAREGCLKPFLHTKENVHLTIYFMQTLQQFVETYLKSLSNAHLHGIVKVFNQVMSDPFIDFSPPLIEQTCSTMSTVIEWTWPRLEPYKYTILLGLTKANALESECAKKLNIPSNEMQVLKSINQGQ